MNKFCLLFLLCICFGGNAYAYSDYYQDGKRGWFWYEDKAKKPEKKTQPVDTQMPKYSANTALEELQMLQRDLEESKAAMIMRPSIDNTKRYLAYQKVMFDKSDIVAKNWRDALLSNPEINPARDIPISAVGARVKQREEDKFSKDLLMSASKKFKLLFFYKSSCVYCINFAEVLEVFARRYGFKVAAVTMDGKSIAKFPASYNPGLIEKFGVSYSPALFAYSEELGVAVPIGEGFMAIDQLESNATYVLTKLKDRL